MARKKNTGVSVEQGITNPDGTTNMYHTHTITTAEVAGHTQGVYSTTYGSSSTGNLHSHQPSQGVWAPFPHQPSQSTPWQPAKGAVGMINGVPHKYDGENWNPIEPTDETVGAPEVRVVLDASAMLNALRSYRDFLNDLDGLDKETANVVDDTLFGLREAIEALEKIGLK